MPESQATGDSLQVFSIRLPKAEIAYIDELASMLRWSRRKVVLRAIELLRQDAKLKAVLDAFEEMERVEKKFGIPLDREERAPHLEGVVYNVDQGGDSSP